jgi:predicted acylesterase/phospholipase RssA
MTKKPSPSASKLQYDKQVALVLQGGGALGSYQAGVYEALAEHYQPDWVAGISIGAINCAIIAGNAPEDRVAKFEGRECRVHSHGRSASFGSLEWRTACEMELTD